MYMYVIWHYVLGKCTIQVNMYVDRLIDYLLFSVPLKNSSLIWRRHHYRWRAAKFRPMFGAQGLWAGRDLDRATPTVTRILSFFRSHSKDHPIRLPLMTHKGMWRSFSSPDPHGNTCMYNMTLHNWRMYHRVIHVFNDITNWESVSYSYTCKYM
jgi:hypothetical protein